MTKSVRITRCYFSGFSLREKQNIHSHCHHTIKTKLLPEGLTC